MSVITRTTLKSSGPHDYHKNYKQYDVVDHTIGTSTKTYLAIKDVPQHISILNTRFWKEIPSDTTNDETINELLNARADWNETSEESHNYIQNKPTLGSAAAKDSTNQVTENSTDLVESGAVKQAIDTAISSAYHHAGTKTVAELLSALLIAENEGNVYNITDSGVTTADFIEGAGKTINIGDNVGIAKVGENSYKFDILSGFMELSALQADWTETDNTKPSYVKNKPNIEYTSVGAQTTTANVTFDGNDRDYIELTTADNLTINISTNNNKENYILITNTSNSEITITVGTITLNNTAITNSNVLIVEGGISCGASAAIEISIIAFSSRAIITCSGNLVSKTSL